MSLSCKFYVYLHFTLLFTSWSAWPDHRVLNIVNFASDKASFCKNTNTLQVKNFTLKVLIVRQFS